MADHQWAKDEKGFPALGEMKDADGTLHEGFFCVKCRCAFCVNCDINEITHGECCGVGDDDDVEFDGPDPALAHFINFVKKAVKSGRAKVILDPSLRSEIFGEGDPAASSVSPPTGDSPEPALALDQASLEELLIALKKKASEEMNMDFHFTFSSKPES